MTIALQHHSIGSIEHLYQVGRFFIYLVHTFLGQSPPALFLASTGAQRVIISFCSILILLGHIAIRVQSERNQRAIRPLSESNQWASSEQAVSNQGIKIRLIQSEPYCVLFANLSPHSQLTTFPRLLPYLLPLIHITLTGSVYTTIAVACERCITVLAPFTQIKVTVFFSVFF